MHVAIESHGGAAAVLAGLTRSNRGGSLMQISVETVGRREIIQEEDSSGPEDNYMVTYDSVIVS